jgi:hypothetical protein
VTDANGCFGYDTIVIDTTCAQSCSLIADAGPTECASGPFNGTFIGGSPTASNGTWPYSYQWTVASGTISQNTGSPFVSLNGSATTAFVTITDANGCVATDSTEIVISNLSLDVAATDTICVSGPNYTAQLGGNPTVSGGTSPYSYYWMNSLGSGAFSNDTAANTDFSAASGMSIVWLFVTDSNNCALADSVYIDTNCNAQQPCNLLVNAAATDTICVNSTNLYAAQLGGNPTATGGVAPYTYQWINTGTCGSFSSQSSPSPTFNTCTGSSLIRLIVTDANGCSGLDSVVVDTFCVPQQPCNLQVKAASTDTICLAGSINGYIAQLGASPTASGGTSPYAYQWVNNGTCGSFNHQGANPMITVCTGSSEVILTVTDAFGCQGADTVVIDTNCVQPCNLIVDAGPNECANSPFGGTFVGGSPTASNGVWPYSYQWSIGSGSNSNFVTLNGADTTVFVTVTDNIGCVGVDSTEVVISTLTASAAATDTLCVSAGPLGYVAHLGGNPTASGGTMPYTYYWINTVGSGSFNNTSSASPIFSTVSGYSRARVFVTDSNNCYASDSVVIDTNCTYDVWPGDANSDGLASIVDILPIGIGYGSTGPVRSNASLNWVGQPAADWGTTLITGADYKHADCNGDGTIDQNDLNAILLNYGLTHSKGEENTSYDAVNPNLSVEVSADTVGLSSVVTATINLGDVINQADSIYGVTFSLNYDPALVDTTSLSVDYSNSWLGDISNSSDMVSLDKNLVSSGRVDIGLTRTNQMNNSGSGEIAAVEIFTIDDLTGKQTLYETLNLTISNVRVITKFENEVDVNIMNDNVVISDDPALGIQNLISNEISIFPNPTNGMFTVNMVNEDANLKLFDATGRQLRSQIIQAGEIINIQNLINGVYYVTLNDGETVFSQKLIKK